MPVRKSKSSKDAAAKLNNSKGAAAASDSIDQNSSNWDASKQNDDKQNFSTDTIKSNSSQKSVETSSASTESPSIELGKEAKEKDGSSSKHSWVKNIGNGMRTLRFRKSTDKSSSNLNNNKDTIGKGIKMSIMDDEQKSNHSREEDDHQSEKSVPLSPIASDIRKHSSSSSSAAPPNVIPPFEEPPKSSISKKEQKKSSSSSGLGSLKKEHMKRWRKLGGGSGSGGGGGGSGSPSVNGNSSKTGNGTVPSLQRQKSNASTGEGESPITNKADPSRFIGEGLSFKAKLIGVLEVSGPRGDRICQEALSELKVAVKAAGEHKQKVTVHVALDGLRLRDERTGDCLYHHQVHKISFIAQDLTDSRAFGYIFGSPDTGHRFFGIKTEKSASQVVMAMRDLFQVVFDLKKKEIERAKQQLEMQQKFLATRAAESTPRTENKSNTAKIAETYIEGACALTPTSSPRTTAAPAEADLLNLEVELSSLQAGLENIHSNLMESRQHQNPPFNRGSTTSISSDQKYPGTCSSAPPYNTAGSGIVDPFGDSFDPFDGNKFSDPFSNVDPFPLPKPGAEELDPFKSPPSAGGFSFSFASEAQMYNSSTANSGQFNSNYSKLSEASNGAKAEQLSQVKHSSEKPSLGWTASFEDNFIPEVSQSKRNSETSNGPNSGEISLDGSGIHLDIFNELDPLGTGKARPFVDRKDFFQDVKNPPKKNLKDLYSSSGLTAESVSAIISSITTTNNSQALKPDGGNIPNSFSTNFNPAQSTNNSSDKTIDFDSHFKIPLNKTELKTSSIRARLRRSESPPNYSPPPPPSASQVSNSIYFVNPIKPSSDSNRSNNNTNNNIKKSPQLLKRMTISSSSGVSSSTSPRASSRGSGRHFTLDSSSTDEIPNLTPPPRPPHSATLNRNSTIATAVPRPHSAKSEVNRQNSLQIAPEPPPRPLQTSVISTTSFSGLPLVSPPPLPPKKQAVGQIMPNTLANGKLFGAQGKSSIGNRISESGSASSNDLPLPLPCRKNGNDTISIPRYAVPPSFDREVGYKSNMGSPAAIRKQLDNTKTIASLAQSNTNLTMEQALGQVASLSLGELALKLELPVEQLSSLTIQQLAEKLTLMNLNAPNTNTKPFTSGFESNFDDDFSTASAPSTMEGVAKRDQDKTAITTTTTNYDRYAVFRELTLEEASGFSVVSMNELMEIKKDGSGSGSKTLTSRDSSSERTLQADDEPENPMATMDDITDTNFSDGEEKSILNDEIVDPYFESNKQLPEWATFESNFEDQCIPLQTGFNKSEESPSWESDEGVLNPYPFPSEGRPKLKTTKIDAQSSQFDFQPFQKQSSRIDDAVEEGESHLDPLVQSNFQRQSSGSSKHSDKCSDKASFSGSIGHENRHERTGSGRRLELPPPGNHEVRRKRESRDSRPSSYSSSGRKYSRGESDDLDEEYRHHRKHRRDREYDYEYEERRRRYYEEGGVENPSFDPTIHPPSAGSSDRGKRRARSPRGDFEDDENEENDIEEDNKSHSSRYSNYSPGSRHRQYPRRKHHKYYSHSQSLQRRGRDGRYEGSRRGEYSPERYSNHESDFDSYEDEISSASASRKAGRERDYHSREEYSSRPSSSGSGRKHHSHYGYRGSSTDHYHREPRHDRRHHYYKDRRHRESPYEPNDEQDASEYSGEDTASSHRRGHTRRPPPPSIRSHHRQTERRHRDKGRDSDRYYYYNTNSPSWDSESSPAPAEQSSCKISERRRHSAGKSGLRPSSTSICDPLDNAEKSCDNNISKGFYQSELTLNTKSNQLSAKEFHEFDTSNFSAQHPRQKSDPVTTSTPKEETFRKFSLGENLFEDNFILPSAAIDNSDNIKSKKEFESQISQEQDQQQNPPQSASTIATSNTSFQSHEESEVFFPSTFDTEKEVGIGTSMTTTEQDIIHTNMNKLQDEQIIQQQEEKIKTPEFTSSESKILTMISEESHISTNSNSNTNTYNSATNNDITAKDSMPNIHEENNVVPKMKKSDSFNIFDRERDPFADEDFFQ